MLYLRLWLTDQLSKALPIGVKLVLYKWDLFQKMSVPRTLAELLDDLTGIDSEDVVSFDLKKTFLFS